MVDGLGDLSAFSVDDLVEEIKRRTKCLIVGAIVEKQYPNGEKYDHFFSWWGGGTYHALGVLAAFRCRLEEAVSKPDGENELTDDQVDKLWIQGCKENDDGEDDKAGEGVAGTE